MVSDDSKLSATVVIRTDSGSTRYHVLIPKSNVNGEKHCRSVLASGVEMSCALLDATYQKDEKND